MPSPPATKGLRPGAMASPWLFCWVQWLEGFRLHCIDLLLGANRAYYFNKLFFEVFSDQHLVVTYTQCLGEGITGELDV